MQIMNYLQDLPRALAATNADVTVYVTPLSGVGPPSNLLLTDLGLTTVQATWSAGTNSTYTMLRGSRSGIPTSITDGELIYYDTGTTHNITNGVLLLINYQDIYVSAWSYGSDNITVSNSYASAHIGGETMEELAEEVSGLSDAIASLQFQVDFNLLFQILLVLGILYLSFKANDIFFYIVAGLITMFISVSWVQDYPNLSIPMFCLGGYHIFRAIIMAFQGGSSKGWSQFKSIWGKIREKL